MGIKDLQKHIKFNAHAGQFYIINGKLQYNDHKTVKKYPVAGATAEFESADVATSRPTLTRIAAGALIAGPVGAIVGGMFQKDTAKCYIVVTLADGKVLIGDMPAGKSHDARMFVQAVNDAGVAYQD